jgi:hypothetical protein
VLCAVERLEQFGLAVEHGVVQVVELVFISDLNWSSSIRVAARSRASKED